MNKKVLIFLIFSMIGGVAVGVIAGKGMQSYEVETPEGNDAPSAPRRFSLRGSDSGEKEKESSEGEKEESDNKIYETLTYEQVRERLYALNEDESLSEKEGYNTYYLLYRWGALSPKSALAEIKDLNKIRRSSSAEYAIMNGWARKDPESAAAYYMEERGNNLTMRNYGVSAALIDPLVEASPEKAWDFYSGLSKKERAHASFNFVWSVLENNPGELQKYSEVFKDIPSYNRSDLIMAWKDKDKTGYERWKESLPEEERNEVVIKEMAQEIGEDLSATTKMFSEFSLERQKEFLSQRLDPGFEKLGTVKMFDWLLENAPKGMEQKTLVTHMGMMTSQEYVEVESWVDSLPAGVAKNVAIGEIAEKKPIPGYDMSRTMRMAQSLDDEKARKKAVESTLRNWAESDSASALKWLNNSSGFSEKELTEWRQKIEKANKPLIK